jgi:hypothetical protein
VVGSLPSPSWIQGRYNAAYQYLTLPWWPPALAQRSHMLVCHTICRRAKSQMPITLLVSYRRKADTHVQILIAGFGSYLHT